MALLDERDISVASRKELVIHDIEPTSHGELVNLASTGPVRKPTAGLDAEQ